MNEPKITEEVRTTMRQQYMDNAISHVTYYCWLADNIGLTESMVPPDAKHSTDEHFNDVPLHLWDKCDRIVRYAAMQVAGLRSWALSDTVCCLKALAERARDLRK